MKPRVCYEDKSGRVWEVVLEGPVTETGPGADPLNANQVKIQAIDNGERQKILRALLSQLFKQIPCPP